MSLCNEIKDIIKIVLLRFKIYKSLVKITSYINFRSKAFLSTSQYDNLLRETTFCLEIVLLHTSFPLRSNTARQNAYLLLNLTRSLEIHESLSDFYVDLKQVFSPTVII